MNISGIKSEEFYCGGLDFRPLQSFRILKLTYLNFSLKSFAISLYKNILHWTPNKKFIWKNDHLWKYHNMANSKNSYNRFEIYSQFFWICDKNYICRQNFMKIQLKTRYLYNFFTFCIHKINTQSTLMSSRKIEPKIVQFFDEIRFLTYFCL